MLAWGTKPLVFEREIVKSEQGSPTAEADTTGSRRIKTPAQDEDKVSGENIDREQR